MSLSVRLIRWVLANALLAGISFLCAGGLSQPTLKLYLIAFGIMDFIGILVINSALAAERSLPASEGTDPAVRPIASALFMATVAFAALDVGRLHWAHPFPKGVQMVAFAIFVAANALQIWAMAVNAFFSTELRLQVERNHQLIRNGPYRYVRHPGYLAMLLIVPSTAFAIGSKVASLPATMYGALILFRAVREDRFLLRNLPGYADYLRGAPYRLIPGVW
ncbi:MAG: isoprenylcysteine carboxylmethyltransferase family protein [Terriglobia bacterium]